MDPFTIGNVIAGKYEITRVLGQGGMGVVVAARNRDLGELVALKFLRPSSTEKPESLARFAREVRTATRIKNEHVARVHDAGTFDGAPYMVMEYLTGEDLAHLLRRRGPLPAAEAVDLLLQACEAIADAHNLGVVHRDLKPANLFVTTSSDGAPFVKVLDFGISKAEALGDPSVTATAAVVGSPLYMSPEQLASSRGVDARADVWALGVILYEMLAGKPPFAGESFATLSAAILRGTYAPVSSLRPDCPPPLEEAIAKALARDREARLPTVVAFAAAIAPCGTDAARGSLQRIERIAARVPPVSEPAEGDMGEKTEPRDPPSSVARVMNAPGEITQPPPLGTSIAPSPRRARPAIATLGLAGAVAAVLVVVAVLGVKRWSGSPAATASAAGVEAQLVPESDAAPATSTASADGGPLPWHATPITLPRVTFGEFAVAQPPSHEHPQGVIAALAYPPSSEDRTAISVYALDVESGARVENNLVGYLTHDSVVGITATPRGVIVAHQAADYLDLEWYTDGTTDGGMRTLRQFGAKKGQRVRGLAAFDDRIVLATSPVQVTSAPETTTVWLLDGQGKLLGSYACHGGLHSPGDAQLVRSGDDVLVANLVTEKEGVPICAGRLHGPPRWREVTLHDGTIEVAAGGVYFHHSGGPGQPMLVNALDENLRPTGLPPPGQSPLGDVHCEGLTGSAAWRTEEIGGQQVVYMVACCGDTGGGLFVCRPPKRGP